MTVKKQLEVSGIDQVYSHAKLLFSVSFVLLCCVVVNRRMRWAVLVFGGQAGYEDHNTFVYSNLIPRRQPANLVQGKMQPNDGLGRQILFLTKNKDKDDQSAEEHTVNGFGKG